MADGNGQSEKDAYLAKLRAQVERLMALIKAVESEGEVLSLDGAAAAFAGRAPTDSQVRPDSFYAMTTPQATRKFLEMMGKGNPQTPLAIVDALIRGGLDKAENRSVVIKNVYTALKRGKDKEFVKIQKEWGLAEWYPNRKEEKVSGKGRKKKKRGAGRRTKPAAPAQAEPVIGARGGFGAFNEFVKEQLAVGKTRQEAIVEWRRRGAH